MTAPPFTGAMTMKGGMERRLFYSPNLTHKRETTEAGQAGWIRGKEPCPVGMTIVERDELVRTSVSESGDPLDPVRYGIRRCGGRLEWFISRLTREHPDGRIEIHGHPFRLGYPKVPPRAARRLRDAGLISPAEYKDAVNA